jgi:hypothetical protein
MRHRVTEQVRECSDNNNVSEPTIPPGFYPDPDPKGVQRERLWDGTSWLSTTRPAPSELGARSGVSAAHTGTSKPLTLGKRKPFAFYPNISDSRYASQYYFKGFWPGVDLPLADYGAAQKAIKNSRLGLNTGTFVSLGLLAQLGFIARGADLIVLLIVASSLILPLFALRFYFSSIMRNYRDLVLEYQKDPRACVERSAMLDNPQKPVSKNTRR